MDYIKTCIFMYTTVHIIIIGTNGTINLPLFHAKILPLAISFLNRPIIFGAGCLVCNY